MFFETQCSLALFCVLSILNYIMKRNYKLLAMVANSTTL